VKYVLDTHVWVWSIHDPERLAAPVRTAIEDGEHELLLSCITYWELEFLVRKGQVDLGGDLSSWLEFAHREYSITDVPIDRRVALDSQSRDLPGRDPADRFIAATTRVHDAILLTQDRQLLESPAVPSLAL